MMRTSLCVLFVLTTVGPALAQPTPAPPVDRKNPEAVVRAYMKACEGGDVKAAVALLDDKPGIRQGLAKLVDENHGAPEPGAPNLVDIMREYLFVPGMVAVGGPTTVQAKPGADAIFTVTTQVPMTAQAFQLVKGADGNWSIDLEKSLKLTTGKAESMLMSMLTLTPPPPPPGPDGAPGPGVITEGPPESTDWEAQSRIRDLASALRSYAAHHGNKLPPAATWTDEMEKYCLDRSILHRKGLKPGEFGYAINVNAAGKPLPDNWEQQRAVVIVYESTDLSRNAAGDPEALPRRKPGSPAASFATACYDVFALPVGMTLLEYNEARIADEGCQKHLQTIANALLAYARDHDGLLPPAATWCDDIGLYLDPGELTADLFRCPANPDAKFAYALNADLAGKNVHTLNGHGNYVLLLHGTTGTRNEVRTVPKVAHGGQHVAMWGSTSAAVDLVAMLDGNTRGVSDGQPYEMRDVPPPPPAQ